MKNLFDIKDKVVVITGAGGVLCGCMAKSLGAHGAKVAVLDLNLGSARAVADQIKADGGEAIALECNVLEKDTIEKAKEAVVKAYGKVDVLINGAGGNHPKATTGPDMPLFDIPAEAIQFVFNLNFLGSLLPTQVFGKVMADNGEGTIINISSMNAFKPLTRIPAYSAAKAAISNFTQWLATHMCQNYSTKIRVNAIAPGFFITNQNRFLVTDEKTGQYTARGQSIVDHTPMNRFGDAEELNGTLIWLISEAGKFVTGVVVPVDGGYSAFGGV
jgi:NAD(P)-dependent dehydrogenase (short-subunit alcohol dehydrogenase family)